MTKRMDVRIGGVLGKDPKMIRFYANSMMLELELGRQLTPIERRKVFNNSRVGVWKEAEG